MKPQTLLSVLRECTELGLLAHLDAAASAALERQVRQMHPKTHPMTLAVLAAAPDTIWRCPAAPQADSPAALLAALRTLGHGHFPVTEERAQPLATPDGEALGVSFTLGERRYEAVISLGQAPLERVVDLANRTLADAGDDGRFEWLFFREEATRTTEAGPYRAEALIFLTYEQHGQVVQRDLARLAEHYRYPLAVPRGFEDTTRDLQALGLLDPRDAARLGEVRAAWQQRGSPPELPALLPAFGHSVCFFDLANPNDTQCDILCLLARLSAISRGGFMPQDLKVSHPPNDGAEDSDAMVLFSIGAKQYSYPLLDNEVDYFSLHFSARTIISFFWWINRVLASQASLGRFYPIHRQDGQGTSLIYMTNEQHTNVVETALLPLGDDD